MRKRKKIIVLAIAILCMMAASMTVSAAKYKKYNLDKYVGMSKSYTLLAYNPSQRWVYVRSKKSNTSRSYGKFNYGGAVIVNTKALKKGVKTSWIPVYMNNLKTRNGWRTGYVLASRVKLHKLYTKKFSNNGTINRAIKTGFRYLGTRFQLPGASLTNGIDCAQFVAAVYRAAGRGGLGTHTDYLQAACRQIFYQTRNRLLTKSQLRRLKAGDLMFYRKNDTTGPIDHVGIYIGDGFMINASGHYGEVYPNGGICIKRIQYGNRKIIRCMRLRGF